MRLNILLFLSLSLSSLTTAQTSLDKIGLENGNYSVGFRHYTATDSTRTYSRAFDYSNKTIARPIPISIWYPSTGNGAESKPLQVVDYLEILKEEEEWEHLPNEQILNWFYYPNTPSNQKHLGETTTAFANAELAQKKFPVIIYTPSFQASSIENFALCEYVASHGFIVLASPSRGAKTRWFSDHAMAMETQARDVEFLIKVAGQFPNSDYDKMGVLGFSFGGLSNIIVQNRNDRVKAIVSLDGTERYQYGLLQQSPFFDPKNMDVPYLHMAQKNIPEIVLKEDYIDPKLNTTFQLFDSITNSKAYKLKFNDLTHSYFSTLGVLFANRDKRQDKSDIEIMESYKMACWYTLNFLKAALYSDENIFNFLENNTPNNLVESDLITKESKQPKNDRFTFQDFNDLASSKKYEDLENLYDSIVRKHSSFKIPEGNLNTLGLQLVFNPDKSQQGIQVFLLAIKLYPGSSNLYDSMGEGYLFIGEKENAIKSFTKSLALNPQNQNAIRRLEELKY